MSFVDQVSEILIRERLTRTETKERFPTGSKVKLNDKGLFMWGLINGLDKDDVGVVQEYDDTFTDDDWVDVAWKDGTYFNCYNVHDLEVIE